MMNPPKVLVEMHAPAVNIAKQTVSGHVEFSNDYNQMVLGDGSQAHFKRLLLEALRW